MSTLREIVYLDRERVHSYTSQLDDGLTTELSSTAAQRSGLTGGVEAALGPVNFQVGAERGADTSTQVTRIPAHAVLATLESSLTRERLLRDAAETLVLPGQIGRLTGDATFESWGLLASLADSVQGIATLGAKIYRSTRGQRDLQTLKRQVAELERLLKLKTDSVITAEHHNKLAQTVGMANTVLGVIDGGYIENVKEVVKLFFQDQNHFRISSANKSFVGLLRRENFVGSTMEELLFSYGSQPKVAFSALFYVTELARNDVFDPARLPNRMAHLQGKPFSFGVLQEAIRDIGTAILECAEELRRPTGEESAFIVPLAVYREVRGA